jgi:hypothetical protein
MADEEAIRRKRERLADETHEYFWNVCPELTARWKRAMLTLPPSVLRDLAVEIKHLGAVTNWANQQLHAALGAGGVDDRSEESTTFKTGWRMPAAAYFS